MPSSPSSPRTPTHRRHRSSRGAPTSPIIVESSPMQRPRSRKSSMPSPMTPRHQSVQGVNAALGAAGEFQGDNEMGNGLGSLADELAEGWDEDEEADMEDVSGLPEGDNDDNGGAEAAEALERAGTQTEPTTPISKAQARRETLSPGMGGGQNRSHHRRKESQYDGSDYGSESDLEPTGLTRGLETRISEIEALARQGQVLDGAQPADDVIQSVIAGLRDLGGQASVENGATRLITAHTALTTHLAHQTRSLHSLTYPLLSPLSIPPSAELIDTLLPFLTDLASAIPEPTTLALHSLADLHALSADLTATLSYLSDSLHMSRQTTTAAARKLRATKELVDEIRRDSDGVEEGIRWIERGKWNDRLEGRECAAVCGEVVGGFEEVLEDWRRRLIGGASIEVPAA
ncbi:MAG: eukaryotic translation initiation factor 3 subunit A [Chaenotheca gracillima]|nr:MAG: eukaryotic translation initiation factor 3 subunit A [Chaenotheca gracillima]